MYLCVCMLTVFVLSCPNIIYQQVSDTSEFAYRLDGQKNWVIINQIVNKIKEKKLAADQLYNLAQHNRHSITAGIVS